MRRNYIASPSTPQMVFAHSSLQCYCGPGRPLFDDNSWDDYRIEFVDYTVLNSERAFNTPVLLPVGTEQQAEQLHSVRGRCPMSLLIAVTHDITGHSTYYAIRSGATFVINLAIPSRLQIDLLRAHLGNPPVAVDGADQGPDLQLVSTGPDAQSINKDVLSAVHGSAEAPPRTDCEPDDGHRTLSRAESDLVRMLRTSMTIAEIARHNYMSERSMYRRIRTLYNTLGVTGRGELMNSAQLGGPSGGNRPPWAGEPFRRRRLPKD